MKSDWMNQSANENDRIAVDSEIFKLPICMFHSILIQFDVEFWGSFVKGSNKVIVEESLVTLFLAIGFRKRSMRTHIMRNKIKESKRKCFFGTHRHVSTLCPRLVARFRPEK